MSLQRFFYVWKRKEGHGESCMFLCRKTTIGLNRPIVIAVIWICFQQTAVLISVVKTAEAVIDILRVLTIVRFCSCIAAFAPYDKGDAGAAVIGTAGC